MQPVENSIPQAGYIQPAFVRVSPDAHGPLRHHALMDHHRRQQDPERFELPMIEHDPTADDRLYPSHSPFDEWVVTGIVIVISLCVVVAVVGFLAGYFI